uniref:Uncharacterized protein n=1 Tax=Arundo donax TaxID=35708 RepID=A0A0A9GXW0_ARUDO
MDGSMFNAPFVGFGKQ